MEQPLAIDHELTSESSNSAEAPETWRLLGSLLVEQGVIGSEDLEQALAIQQATGKKLGEILVEAGLLSRPTLARALADQFGVELQEENGYGTGLLAQIERRHHGQSGASDVEESSGPAAADEPRPAGSDQQPASPQVFRASTEQENFLIRFEEEIDLGDPLDEPQPMLPAGDEGLAERDRLVAELAEGEDVLAELRQRMEAERERLADALERVAAREQRLEDLSAALEAHERLLETQERAMGELSPKLEQQERTLSAAGGTLAEREQQLVELEHELAAHNDLVEAERASIAKLRSGLEGQCDARRSLEAALAESERQVADLEAAIDAPVRLLAELQEREAQLAGQVPQVEERLRAAEEALAERTGRLAELEPVLAAQDRLLARIEEQAAAAAQLEPALAAQEQPLTQLAEYIATITEVARPFEEQRKSLRLAEARLAEPEPAADGFTPSMNGGHAGSPGNTSFVDLRTLEIDRGLARFFPEAAARRYEALPIKLHRGVVIVALANPADEEVRETVRDLLAREARFVRADREQLLEAIAEIYGPAPAPEPPPNADPGATAPVQLETDSSEPPETRE